MTADRTYTTTVGSQTVQLPLVQLNDDLVIALLISVDLGVSFSETAGRELADLMRVADHVVPADRGVAAVRPQQRGQDPYRGCLPRAVRAQQAEYRAGANREVDPVQCERFAKALDQPFGHD